MNYQLNYQTEKEFQEDYITTNILECINFWNKQGEDVRQKNIDGIYGNKETQEYAKNTPYDDWLNEMILEDCKTFCRSDKNTINYKCGRTRSHVWLHVGDERVLMIYAEKK